MEALARVLLLRLPHSNWLWSSRDRTGLSPPPRERLRLTLKTDDALRHRWAVPGGSQQLTYDLLRDDDRLPKLWMELGFVVSSCNYASNMIKGRYMAQAVSCRPLTAKVRVQSQAILYGVYGGKSGTGTGISPRSPVFPLSMSFHQSSKLIHP
jgi:hypothetical protein